MPFIDSKLTMKITDRQKEEIKAELGRLIATLNKSEAYLMVGIEDSCDLWLGGKKLDKGAYVAVSLYGSAPKESYDRLTGQICELLSEKLGIPGNAVYVTYHPVSDWGWNGRNFCPETGCPSSFQTAGTRPAVSFFLRRKEYRGPPRIYLLNSLPGDAPFFTIRPD